MQVSLKWELQRAWEERVEQTDETVCRGHGSSHHIGKLSKETRLLLKHVHWFGFSEISMDTFSKVEEQQKHNVF